MRVAIAAQSVAMRLGLKELLRSLPGIEVSADSPAESGLSGIDVLVVTSAEDLHLTGEETRPVLLLTNKPEEAARLADLQVWGVLPLEASVEEISAALHALGEGLWVGSPAFANSLLERHQPQVIEAGEPVSDPLTQRELEVLQLAAEGMANKQIALALNISEHTVKFHLSSLYAKLGVTSRTEAIRAGVRQGRVVM
jgi:Response regulator containing a CheY-like receiver domain and an HTH DNA-binding domain